MQKNNFHLLCGPLLRILKKKRFRFPLSDVITLKSNVKNGKRQLTRSAAGEKTQWGKSK